VFRSIGAVLLGYVTGMVLIMAFGVSIMLILLGKLPDPNAHTSPLTLKVCLAYVTFGVPAMIVAGYVTAWVAGKKELAHAAGLVAFYLFMGGMYLAGRLNAENRPEPLWYLITNMCTPVVTIPLGALLRARQVKARGLS
jgi:hypothetical protein